MKRFLRIPGSLVRPHLAYGAERDAALHPIMVQNSFQPLLLPALLVAVVSYAQQPGQAPAAPEAGRVDFEIVDVATGYAIGSAEVRWDMAGRSLGSELSHSGVASQGGRFVQQLSPGDYLFEISAAGYKTMRTHDNVAPGSVARAEIDLHPLSPPKELSEARVKPKLRGGFGLVQGYIVDAVRRRPLDGVRVTLAESGATTTSGADGYFELYAPAVSTADLSRPEDFPKPDTLTADAPGYKTYVITGLVHESGSSRGFRIAMTPGTGTTNEDVLPRALRPAGTPPQEPPQATSPIPRALGDEPSLTAGAKLRLNANGSAKRTVQDLA